MMQNLPQMFWERIDPFNVYWSPGASRIEDAEILERKRLTRTDLNDLIGLPGYDEAAVRAALQDYDHGLRDWIDSSDTEEALTQGKESPHLNQSHMIDALEYHGNVQGHMLLIQGVDARQIPDLDREYSVQTWIVGSQVLKTQINPSPRQRHPYYVTSFEKVPGTVAGHGLPDMLEDLQEIANATLRSLVNNMGSPRARRWSSTPIAWRRPRTRRALSVEALARPGRSAGVAARGHKLFPAAVERQEILGSTPRSVGLPMTTPRSLDM
jgi:hypothetical protein